MRRILRNATLLGVVLLSAAACTRRVQVESEPNQPRYLQSASVAPAAIDIAGVYDYAVDVGEGQTETGPMTIARSGDGYTVAFQTGFGDVQTSNIVRAGNALNMDVVTVHGAGTIELTWSGPNEAAGTVFLGDAMPIRATRRP